MCLDVGGPVCIMTRTMGTSQLKYQQNRPASCTAGTGALWHETGVCLRYVCEDTRMEGGWKRALRSSNEQISSSETLDFFPPPPLGFTARSVPCGGLEEIALTYCTMNLRVGCKKNTGQWDRMFLDNVSCEKRSSHYLPPSPHPPCRSVWRCGRSALVSWLRGPSRMHRGSQRGQHSFEMYG